MSKKDCIQRSNLRLSSHQEKVVKFLNRDNIRGLLAIHDVGSGKTLTAVTASQCFLDKHPAGNIIVVTPTSLQQNFKKEMINYGTNPKDSRYQFFTIQGFAIAMKKNKVHFSEHTFLIVDEAHNIRSDIFLSESDENPDEQEAVTGIYANYLNRCSKMCEKVLLLTATPLINRPSEIVNLITMIDGIDPIPGKAFKYINLNEFFKCKVSLYSPPEEKRFKDYPKVNDNEIFLEMSPSYLESYRIIEEFPTHGERAFYNGVRKASNSLEGTISPKINWILKHIEKSDKKDKYVIFSHFLSDGLKLLIERLKKEKISYRSITGDIDMKKRAEIVDEYNNDQFKVLLISKAGSEGLDLKCTTNLIIMEPSWNESTHRQVIGRAVRNKSHENLPLNKRVVNVYRLFHVKPIEGKHLSIITNELWTKNKLGQDKLSVDLFLRNFSHKKQKDIDKFYDLLKESSIEQNLCSSVKNDIPEFLKKIKNVKKMKPKIDKRSSQKIRSQRRSKSRSQRRSQTRSQRKSRSQRRSQTRSQRKLRSQRTQRKSRSQRRSQTRSQRKSRSQRRSLRKTHSQTRSQRK